MKEIRLDKFLSDNTSFSRSEIKKHISRGAAAVNGITVKNTKKKISPESDDIVFLDKRIEYKQFVYVLLNKPEGVLSACRDKIKKTVVDLVPEYLSQYGLFPVGRLDKDTTGLLLLTNNGDFAHKVISPKSDIEKSYIARVDNAPPENINEIFAQGIVLDDGNRCAPAQAEIIADKTLRIIITEGKYHQIKRMLGTIGLGVNMLHRERIGGLTLPQDLLCGEAIEIDESVAFQVFFINKKL